MNIKMRLQTKINLMNMSIVIPTVFFICFIIVDNLFQNIINSSIDNLLKESKRTQISVINTLEKNKDEDKKASFRRIAPFIVGDLNEKLKMRVQTYDDKGQIIYDSSKNQVSLYDEDVYKGIQGKKAYLVKKIDGKTYIMLSSPIFTHGNLIGVVRYLYIEENGQIIINNMELIMIVIGCVGIIIAWMLTNLFSKNIVNPIEKLKVLSGKVARGNYGDLIHINSGDEIEALAKTFNIMSLSIDKNIKSLKEEKLKQKEFLDNVTHEFKTPLTAIIGFSEIIPKLKDEKEIKNSSEYIQKEGTRLLSLVEELLELSKLGRNEFDVTVEKIDIKEVVDEALKTLNLRLSKYHIEVLNAIQSHYVIGDIHKTKQVILNVLDNAIKYSGCEEISITSISENEELILSIKDDGMGIEEKFLSKIFEPFMRGSNNLAREKKGCGIGLSISKEIMTKQEGNIEVLSRVGEGTEVKLTFKNV